MCARQVTWVVYKITSSTTRIAFETKHAIKQMVIDVAKKSFRASVQAETF